MSINPAQAQRLRLVKQHQAAVQAQAQAQAQADRREAAQRAPVNGQYGAYGFRTLPQPSAAQAKPARLPLRSSTEAPEFRLPERDTAEGLAGLLELLMARPQDDGTVDPDGERRGGHGGNHGDGHGSDRGTPHDGGRERDSRGHGDDTPGDEPGRERGGQSSGDSHAGAGGSGSGDTGAGGGGGSGGGSGDGSGNGHGGSSAGGGSGHGRGDGRGHDRGNGGGSHERALGALTALSANRGRASAGLPARGPGVDRGASADRRRDWVPLPRDPLRDLTPLLAPFLGLQRPGPGADDGAHALASALITFGAATAPPDRPGIGALRLAAMAAYIDAQAAPGALSTLARVKAVLLEHVTTARAAAASPAGARARNRWALLPLELLVCDKPRTAGQRRLAVERLRAAHGFLGRFKSPGTASKGQP